MVFKATGKLPSGKYLERLKRSPHFKAKGFENLSDTPMMTKDASYWKMTMDFLTKNRNTVPPRPIPSIKISLDTIKSTHPVIVWFGHSSYLLKIENHTLLVDPAFSGNAAPVSFMTKAFPGSNIYKEEDMPEIDFVLLTHDHYDHLDYKTISKLKKKVKHFVCSLGIASHLRYWGIDESRITEFDWWESKQIEKNLQMTAAPARHFSGRGIKRYQTLWSSFILKTPKHTIYIGGDSGYDTHFSEIGKRFGPFDIAFLEAGQYNVLWPLIHMMPEETVQAAIDLRAKVLMPVHWGKFSLAMHPWDEPVKRVLAKAAETAMKVIVPKIGEPVEIGNYKEMVRWWEFK